LRLSLIRERFATVAAVRTIAGAEKRRMVCDIFDVP
jgi:hypothetical protein